MSLRPTIHVGAVTFDFGNTLVHVDRPGLRSVNRRTAEALAARGKVADVDAFLAAWSEERERQLRVEVPRFREVDMGQRVIRVLARLRGVAAPAADDGWDDTAAATFVDPEEVALALDAYSAAFVDSIAPVPEAGAMLDRLADRGFRLAILSNWPMAAIVDRFAEVQGWSPRLVGIVVSQRAGTIKPHPEIFRQAALLLATPPARILHVGDDWAADVAGALNAGWHAAYVRNRQDGSPLPASAPDPTVEPDMVIDALPEIEARIERWTP